MHGLDSALRREVQSLMELEGRRMSKRKSPLWMPLYVTQYFADTTHMTAAQCGAYVNMLCAMWRSDDGTLPNDADQLARISKVGPLNWARVWKGIKSLFEIDNGRVTSANLQAELGKANAKIVTKRAAAALGGLTTQFRKGRTWTPHVSAHKAPKPLKTNDAVQANAKALNTTTTTIRKKKRARSRLALKRARPRLKKKMVSKEEPVAAPCKPPTTSPPDKPNRLVAALENWGAARYEKGRK